MTRVSGTPRRSAPRPGRGIGAPAGGGSGPPGGAVTVAVMLALALACAPPPSSPVLPTAPVAAVSTRDASPTPVKLRAGYTAIAGSMAPLWAAQDGGYLAREGLDAELINFPSGNEGIQALMAGEVDFLQIAGATTVAAALGGGDTVVLATLYNTLVMRLIARPEIVQPEDLRDKGVGITRLGTTTETAARVALRYFGLEPDRDVALVQSGTLPNILAAMDAGRVAAGIASASISQARQFGFHELLDVGTLGVPYAAAGISTRRSHATQQPDLVRRYLRAVMAGAYRLIDDKPYALGLYRQYMAADDPDLLEETYDFYVIKYLARIPYPDDRTIQGVLDELAAEVPRASEVSPRSFYDDQFIRDLDQSGYFQSLGSR
jgi:NitT/TauT family transport system substrate-binding protein